MVDITAVTTEQFGEFLDNYGYDPVSEVHPLPMAYLFMKTLPWCDDAVVDDDTLIEAQCFIARSISETGGGFDPTAIVEAKTLVGSGLGRNAIVDKWEVNDALIGTDPMSILKSMPLVYGLLMSYMCDHATVTGRGAVSVMVV